ncbi:MAG: tetraacyldisaccharide 4'-kinase [Alphaproteobacteria bacterium]|nr:tetraacyldisaccharide 4'-kinase [Alphaproteobacteria bacterium]
MKAPAFWQTDSIPATLLTPVSWIYAAGAALHRAIRTAHKAPIPVLCVGNLVVGGAGKTPVALSVAARLIAKGKTVHFLSRGYGGRETGPLLVDPEQHDAAAVGDEPLLLTRTAPCWISRDRAAGVRAAAAGGAEIVVMDDGFQNPGIHKDISLVVIDGDTGFGNGRLIPAGPLRESVRSGLRRADAVVLLGGDSAGVTAMIPRATPVHRASITPEPPPELLNGDTVYAFAGIGRPEKFFATLESLNCRVAGRQAFPDHHPYTKREVDELLDRAQQAAAVPVTTEKDHLRLPETAKDQVQTLPITVSWQDADALDRLLDRL